LNRPIRSFVLRQGRTTPAQRRALEGLLPRWGLPFSPEPIKARSIFGRTAPLVLEIGSGMGETTASIAKAHPEADFIAVEVHGPGVGSLLNRIHSENIQNLRVVEVLEKMISDGALAAIHLFFPDPWPKKRHHKRRLVQPAFIALIERKLQPAGIVHAATDWPEYAAQIEEMFSSWEKVGRGFAERPTTKFEARGKRLGHSIRDLYFRRRENPRAAR
jgi:tRNA (guanine-N7-)-methyltransferase